jgi:hypothetical protein
LPPWVPRNSCRSTSICTNKLSCPFTNVVTAGASSSNSSDTTMLVATFRTGSSNVLTAIVLSGFNPPSATPAAPDVAVPSVA